MAKEERIYVVIPDADSDLTIKVIRCLAKEANLFPILVTKVRSNPARFSRFVRKSYVVKSTEEDFLLSFIESEFASKKAIIFPVSLHGFQFVSKNRGDLSRTCLVPPMPDYQLLLDVSDKWEFAKIAKSACLPVLPCSLLEEYFSEREIGNKMDFPLLVKSRNRKGGFGFRIIENSVDLQNVCSGLNDFEKKEYFIQPYIDGVDYSLSVFCRNGQILAHTLWRAVSYGRKRFSIPTVVQFVNDERILDAGNRLIKCLNWDGVADIDFFVERNGKAFWLLEMNARFWQTVGACRAAGVNFPSLQSQSAIGVIKAGTKAKIGMYYARPSGVLSTFKEGSKEFGKLMEIIRINGFWEVFRDPAPEVSQLLRISR